jgi:hypothetical protein
MDAHAIEAGLLARRRDMGVWATKPFVGSWKMWSSMQRRRTRWRVISLVLVREARVVREIASFGCTDWAILKRVM